MGTPLGPKYVPYTFMGPLGKGDPHQTAAARSAARCTVAAIALGPRFRETPTL